MKIGIDLGGSHIAIGVVDKNGKIIEKVEKRLTGIEKKNIKKSIEEYIFENVSNLNKNYKIDLLGIAVPGTVDKETVIKSVNLNLKNYNIVENLKEKMNFEIKVRNDAKCAALAESVYGCLKKYERSIFLTLGTGIGGAVIINGKLLDTGDLPGCEFGHMIIEKNGLLCKCGKFGCWEKYSSMKSFKDKLRQELGYDEKTRGQELLDIIRNNTKDKDNYEIIEKLVEEYIEDLAIGISNLINIFEPEVVGIGGSFVYFEDVLLNRLKNKIQNEDMLFNSRKELKIETAILGNDAGIIGATL